MPTSTTHTPDSRGLHLDALHFTSTPPSSQPHSNHLDIDAVDALIEGLAMFKGGVLMVGRPGVVGAGL